MPSMTSNVVQVLITFPEQCRLFALEHKFLQKCQLFMAVSLKGFQTNLAHQLVNCSPAQLHLHLDHCCPSAFTFFAKQKEKRETKEKKEKVSKQKLLKGCLQGQNVTVLAILKRLEFKYFFCWPTMVAGNIFQCSMALPF